MNAIILSIGDELVLGQTVDTNSAWLSRQLAAVGCAVLAHATVPDDQPSIEAAIRHAAPHCDALIISGGLGPTEDDLTRQALAAVLGAPLELNDSWLAEMQKFFAARRRPMPQTNQIQAMIPRGAQMLWNTCGTAAGLHAQLATGNRQPATDIFVMPGVPKEMKAMFARDVLPHLASRSNGAVILSRTLHTFGLGESSIAEKLGDLMRRDRNPSVGTTVSAGVVSLRLNARFPNKEEAQLQLDQTAAACHAALGDLIYGQDDDTLPQVLANLLLNPKPQTLTTAESCTGGLLAKYITDVSGSSAFYRQGWITYSNAAKYERLGVPEPLIGLYGAVSEPVVKAMADGALRLAKADHALAISGVAGPTGGTPAKPVGTVCIARVSSSSSLTRTFNFPGDREMIRDRAAKMALTMLRYHLLNKPLPF